MSELSERQKLFVEYYLANGFNATQAAISAGYSAKTAREQSSKLLTKLNIQKAVGKEQEKTSKKLEITRESLIEELLEIKSRCLDEEPSAGKFAQYNPALKAIEQIAKMLGLNEPQKIEISGGVETKVVRKFGNRHNQ